MQISVMNSVKFSEIKENLLLIRYIGSYDDDAIATVWDFSSNIIDVVVIDVDDDVLFMNEPREMYTCKQRFKK